MKVIVRILKVLLLIEVIFIVIMFIAFTLYFAEEDKVDDAERILDERSIHSEQPSWCYHVYSDKGFYVTSIEYMEVLGLDEILIVPRKKNK